MRGRVVGVNSDYMPMGSAFSNAWVLYGTQHLFQMAILFEFAQSLAVIAFGDRHDNGSGSDTSNSSLLIIKRGSLLRYSQRSKVGT